jgi:2',3'-cyclic-nucleotide 2'-phosphodiesterase (5'-nucleotidase family)
MKNLIFGLCLITSFSAQAKLLQIIHTNDLHSYFKGYKDGYGGYAKLKVKIDELRADASERGIEVLQLDGGDFGEGTSFFMSQEGVASVEALGMLGTDISVIGNHDHMLGGRVLSDQIKKANIATKFVSANLVATPEMNLNGVVTPYADITKAGTSIRVIGLSTAEAHFQYPLLPGFILPAVPVGAALADEAKKKGKELVIALTHIGLKSDKDLAKKSSGIDLIVGGHSHTRLEEVIYEKNKNNKNVPIVQAGAHGLVVGSLLVDIKENGELEVVEYKLHEILPAMKEDQQMVEFVAVAAEDRNQYFGGRWDEIIGQTLIPLSGYRRGSNPTAASCWGEHMAKMSQEASKADLALHLAQFDGMALEPGQITYGDMIENFPHFRNYGDPGWEISTINVSGKALKVILKAVINLKDMGVNFYGMNYRVFKIPSFIPFIGSKQYAYGLRVNGKKINNKEMYTLAFPSEIGHALKMSLPAVAQKVIPELKNTGHYYWHVMEDYIKNNSPIQCLNTKHAPILTPDVD